MSTITKDQILEGVAALSVMEIVELISAMEEKFGVSAAAAVAGPAAAAEAVEEKTEFDVVLAAVGTRRFGGREHRSAYPLSGGRSDEQ